MESLVDGASLCISEQMSEAQSSVLFPSRQETSPHHNSATVKRIASRRAARLKMVPENFRIIELQITHVTIYRQLNAVSERKHFVGINRPLRKLSHVTDFGSFNNRQISNSAGIRASAASFDFAALQ